VDADRASHLVIGAAIAVHRALGPGLLESAYEACLAAELRERRIQFERQKAIPLRYRNIEVESAYRADLIVESQLIVELKSVTELDPIHVAQMLTYLKVSGLHLGLLINFNVPLLRSGIRRVIRSTPQP
jgi:GxxExxY protein